MANLLAFAKKKVQQVGNVVHNDIAQPIQRDVINPVVNAAPAPVRQVGQALRQDVTSLAAPPIHAVANLNPLTFNVNAVKAGAGLLTGNHQATQNALKPYVKIGQGVKGLAQGTAAQGLQLGESINPIGGDIYKRQFTPSNPFQKAVLGTNSIPSIQAQYKQNKQAHGSAYAGTQAGVTALMDALGAKGIEKPALKAVNDRTPLNSFGAVGKDVNKTPSLPGGKSPENNLTPVRGVQKPAGQGTTVSQAFEQSTNHQPVTNIGKTKFELGSFGVNSANRKAGLADRFKAQELPQTLQNVKGVYKASNDPKSYRSDNVAWVSKMPNGEKRVVYTRKNAAGNEEVINWHKIDETKNPNYISTLESFGNPARIRTGSFGLEHRAESVPQGHTNILPPKGVKVNTSIEPNAQELKIGKALGMSEQDVAKAKAISTPQVSKPDMRVPQGVKEQLNPKVPFKRQQVENTQLNPTKINIPEVKPGDYEQARINPQLASSPIDYATSQTVKAAQRLTPEEQKNIPHLVEDPSLAKSPQAREFVARHHAMTNLSHATSQSLGGNTNFVTNYFRHNVDLSNPADAKRWEELVAKRGGSAADPYAFGGIDNMNRVFKSVKELQNAGFHLKNENNHIQNIIDYGKSTSNTLKRQALVKGFTEADMHQTLKNNNFDLHNGNVIPLSDQGIKEIQGYTRPSKASGAHAGYRAVNRKAKQALLSASEFHPINITSKAAPALVAEGHPILAAKGAYGAFRAQVGRGYSDKLQQSAFNDGTVEAGARLGTPIKFGSDYANEGKLNLGKAGFGEKTIFEKSMPALHIRMVQGLVKDLNKKGIPLDSPEAHAAGTRINEIMGFVNTEARNLNQGRQRGLSDIALAPQFTRSKWATLKSALTEGGVAGSYARRAVAANAATDFVVFTGIGYLLKQKSDDLRDIALRAIFNPAIPTPLKDSKGNTINLKTPASYTSEALGLGVTLERGKDGHLTPKFEPLKVPGNVTNYARNRLAVIPSNLLKVATNTNYAGKPLYDPNAKAGTKAEQAATTVASGLLPIGLQGIAQTKAVKSRLPGNIQNVINANTPGANPLLKSVGSSFGLTPTTDKTVGKGLQSDQYFSALDEAKKGLNGHEKAALELYAGNKKNPVTGKYDVQPNANDTSTKAKALLDQPKVIDNLIAMNTKLKAQGQKVDPLFVDPKTGQPQNTQDVTRVLQYQAMPPGGPDRTHWLAQNSNWYLPLAKQRSDFFGSLPKGDPNKPSAPIEYPNASPSVAAAQQQFFNITDSKQRSAFLQNNPDVQKQLDAQVEYNNKMRVAQGYGALDTFPTASPQVQKVIDAYNSIPKGGGKKGGNLYRSQWIQSHPQEYAAMSKYFTQASLYGLEKDASQAQFKDTGFTSKGLGDIVNLAKYDIGKQTDANGNSFYALGGGGTGGSSGSGYRSYAKSGKTKFITPKIPKIKAPKQPKVAIKKTKIASFKPKKISVSRIPKIKVG